MESGTMNSDMNEKIRTVLKSVIDPEVEVNIVDLGLIYKVGVDGKNIEIEMTLSTPACPLGDVIIMNVVETVKQAYPEYEVDVNLVFDPPWNPDMISAAGRIMIKG
jgi:metal-sulfur cluster biosynthetic enzyme